MNKVVKSYADHQKVNWVQLTDNMFDLINVQLKEVEKAIIGMGNIDSSRPTSALK